MRHWAALIGCLLFALAACGQPPPGGGPAPTDVSPSTTPAVREVMNCEDVEVPHAPEDWYSETPIYVGNEMPTEEVRSFASGLDGFVDVWIDREHNGWIGVGFHEADVAAHQAALEAEFPGVGVVAVDMPHTASELQQISNQIATRLPDGMQTVGVYEVQGYVEVFVGRLTEENIAIASDAIGEHPACISGRDPVTTPVAGPQPEGGDGWTYLGEADTMLESELPEVIADGDRLATVWAGLGIGGTPPEVDFQAQVVLYLVIGHSGSCPETRFDDLIVDGDLVYAVVPSITEEMACTSDWVPRTYLVAMDRDRFPEPPFQIAAEKEYGSRVQVTADLRVPGTVPAEGEVTSAQVEPVREPTPRPFWIETDFPWTLTIDPSCDVDYLGVINDVHWHRVEGTGMPEEWKAAAVDGLIDLELLMTPGPEPTLTASAGGVDVGYLPGPEAEYCS